MYKTDYSLNQILGLVKDKILLKSVGVYRIDRTCVKCSIGGTKRIRNEWAQQATRLEHTDKASSAEHSILQKRIVCFHTAKILYCIP